MVAYAIIITNVTRKSQLFF